MDCSICCEKFNKTFHLKVDCKGCNTEDFACRTCCQTYITSNVSQEASCMFCKTVWDRDFMNKNLTKKFVVNELKIHCENILIEQQISLLPSTQPAAIIAKRLDELRVQIELAEGVRRELKDQDREQKDIISLLQREVWRITNDGAPATEDAANFTIKCPINNCNGFLNNNYMCTLCDTKICKDCMEKKEDGHACNEELKSTVKAIRKDSKPCPSCGENISKIDGCDHMWCVKCHEQFSWKNGTIIRGSNHNPEYFRWMRETGQHIRQSEAARQVVCGVEITDRTVFDIMKKLFPTHDTLHVLFNQIYRFYRHAQWTVREVGGHRERMYQADLERLRIKFLLNKINKQDWKNALQKMKKQNSKENAYCNIWKLAENVIGSFIEDIVSSSNSADGLHVHYIKIAKNALAFKNYINEQFIKTLNTYGSTTCPGISCSWRETPNYKSYARLEDAADENARNAGLRNGETNFFPRRWTDEWTLIYLEKVESQYKNDDGVHLSKCAKLLGFD